MLASRAPTVLEQLLPVTRVQGAITLTTSLAGSLLSAVAHPLACWNLQAGMENGRPEACTLLDARRGGVRHAIQEWRHADRGSLVGIEHEGKRNHGVSGTQISKGAGKCPPRQQEIACISGPELLRYYSGSYKLCTFHPPSLTVARRIWLRVRTSRCRNLPSSDGPMSASLRC